MNEDYVFLPEEICELIDSIGGSKNQINDMYRFIKMILNKSYRDNNSDCFKYTILPYNYISTIFNKNYKKEFLSLMLDNNIIICNNKYSKDYGIPLSYKFNYDKWKDTKFYKYINNNISNLNLSNLSSSLSHPPFNMSPNISKLIDIVGIKKITIKHKSGDKYRTNVDYYYYKIVKELDYNIPKLMNETLNEIDNISIDDYVLDSDILEKVVPISFDDGSPVKFINVSRVLKTLKDDEHLIKNKSKYVISKIDDYIERKKASKSFYDFNSICDVEASNFRSSRNPTNRRLDTNFTNMSGYLLNNIIDNNELVEIDLCNSQIVISTLLIDLDTEDYKLYKKLSLDCGIYEYIAEKCGFKNRKSAKIAMFEVFFSSHNFRGASYKKINSLFPTVLEWINDYKKKNGDNQFSIDLQLKESNIFVDNLYERVKLKKYFVLTKHDSLIIHKNNYYDVIGIVREYFDEIGLDVNIR